MTLGEQLEFAIDVALNRDKIVTVVDWRVSAGRDALGFCTELYVCYDPPAGNGRGWVRLPIDSAAWHSGEGREMIVAELCRACVP